MAPAGSHCGMCHPDTADRQLLVLAVLAIALGTAVFLAANSHASVLRHRILVWLGTISYPLYLLHENIGWSLQLRFAALGISTDGTVLIALATSLAMATALTRLDRAAGHALDSQQLPQPVRPSPNDTQGYGVVVTTGDRHHGGDCRLRVHCTPTPQRVAGAQDGANCPDRKPH